MRLYAERLGQSLFSSGVRVTRLRPPRVVPEVWRRRSWLWRKIDGYVGRFAVYPRLIQRLPVDVVHVVDHGAGILVPQSRCAAHGRHMSRRHPVRAGGWSHRGHQVPQVAFQIFKFSLELMKQAAAIVADSSQTKRDLTDLVGIDPDKINVIFPGLNQPFAPNAARGQALRRRLGWGGQSSCKSGAPSTRTSRVSCASLLDSARMASMCGWRGAAGHSPATRAGSPSGSASRTTSSSWVPRRSEFPALYNAVDLLLFPSLYEGFGWPPLEAMASGTPVVCSRAGSLDEVVGDAALTADPEDIDTLAWHAAAALTDQKVRAAL